MKVNGQMLKCQAAILVYHHHSYPKRKWAKQAHVVFKKTIMLPNAIDANFENSACMVKVRAKENKNYNVVLWVENSSLLIFGASPIRIFFCRIFDLPTGGVLARLSSHGVVAISLMLLSAHQGSIGAAWLVFVVDNGGFVG